MTRRHKYIHWKSVLIAVLAFLVASPAAMAQSSDAEDEPDENTKRMNYSLYFENYRNKDYQAAIPYLRWILEYAPVFPNNNDRNFDRAYETYQALAEAAEDDDARRAYLDSALIIMDEAVSTLRDNNLEIDEFKWTLRRGSFIQSYPEDFPEKQDEVIEEYLEAYELDPERLDPYYVRYIVMHYQEEDMKDEAIEFMADAEGHFSDNPELMAFFDRTRNTLFTSPEERIEWLERQLAGDPENLDLLGELADLYQRTGEREKQRQMATRMVEVQPTARGYQRLAQFHYEEGQFDQAITNYQRALEMPDADEIARRDIHYNMGIMYQEMGRLQNARTHARRALEVDQNHGPSYMLIGDIYVTAVQNQGTLERPDRAVFWLALDYYERARSVDPSVASRANSNIRTYRQYIPTQEDLFFWGKNPGDRHMVDYGAYQWINEATTVRRP